MKLKDWYKLNNLPEPCMTTCDVENEVGLSEANARKLFNHLKKIGAGEIYTQVDSGNGPDVIYSRGVRFVNRTGVYALGDRARWELLNMKRALGMFPILNTDEENERLEAVIEMLKVKKWKV